MMIKEGYLLALGEIFLKSENVQKLLRRKLLANLSLFLKKEKVIFEIEDFRERIFLETKNFKKTKKVLKNLFGICWFARAFFLKGASLKEVKNFVKENWKSWIGKNKTFALRVKREKEIKEKREKIIEQIAKEIKRKVNLKRPQKEIFLEARKRGYFLFFKKERAKGGLPVGSQGKVLVLISGGIDSPVAGFLMAKRGAENLWLHFHSFPLVSKKSIEKVKELAKIFLKFQPKLKVIFVPFSEIQIEIKRKALSKYRVLLYRRVMFKIAQKIAKKEKAQALVTGESLGQVSSQTIFNLAILQKEIKMPILRPLIGMDKEEIIFLAKKIKTFEISILPQEDCCALFVSKGQSAKANLEKIKEIEKKLNLEKLIKSALKESQEEIFS